MSSKYQHPGTQASGFLHQSNGATMGSEGDSSQVDMLIAATRKRRQNTNLTTSKQSLLKQTTDMYRKDCDEVGFASDKDISISAGVYLEAIRTPQDEIKNMMTEIERLEPRVI